MTSSLVPCVLLISFAVAIAGPAGGAKLMPTLPGPCPDFAQVPTLDATKFNGEWNQVFSLKKGVDGSDSSVSKCVKYTNTAQPDGGFKAVSTYTKNGKTETKNLVGTPIDGKSSKLALKNTDDDSTKPPKTLTVVAADDASFYVTVLCGSDGTNHGYLVQVFSRAKTLPDADLVKVKDALKAVTITDELQATEGC